jgi:N-glycosylase/DNA lyase
MLGSSTLPSRRARLRIRPRDRTNPEIVLSAPPPYHLERTLRSGQAFRWTLTPDGARIDVDGSVALVRSEGSRLSARWIGPPASSPRLARYLGIAEPLTEIETVLARDRVIRRVLPYTSGIALMRQDPWECLIAFVISAFNNIPKIQLTIERLSLKFGDPIAVEDGHPAARMFPSPAHLAEATLPSLRQCALGYRAPYVRAIARLVADGDLDLTAVASMPYAQARTTLLALPGVGEKVVECALLFAFGHREAFPVDVWVQRAVEKWYFDGRTMAPREIRAWARDRFGPLTGYAQQHLFAGARTVSQRDRASHY